ncbi:MAG: hypothetical protein ABSG26_05975 [Bryobacteraceae bacterium]|jgi:hypothetical protein
MKRISVTRILVLFAFLIALPGQVRAQQAKIGELKSRVEKLEQLVGQLQRRVADLESQIQERQQREQPIVAKGNWHDIGNWRRLRFGMTMKQVTELLGEPEKVEAGSVLIHWSWGVYPFASVDFYAGTGRVEGWSEPPR